MSAPITLAIKSIATEAYRDSLKELGFRKKALRWTAQGHDCEVVVWAQGSKHNIGAYGSFTVNLYRNRFDDRLGTLIQRGDYWYPVKAEDTAEVRREVAADWEQHGLPWVRAALGTAEDLAELYDEYGLLFRAFELDPTESRLDRYVEMTDRYLSPTEPQLWQHCAESLWPVLLRASRLGLRPPLATAYGPLRQKVGEIICAFPSNPGYHRWRVEGSLISLANQLGWELERLLPAKPRKWRSRGSELIEGDLPSVLPPWLPEIERRPGSNSTFGSRCDPGPISNS